MPRNALGRGLGALIREPEPRFQSRPVELRRCQLLRVCPQSRQEPPPAAASAGDESSTSGTAAD